MKEKKQFRQGDIYFTQVDAPSKADLKAAKVRAREAGRIVIAHGEVTGHAHAVRQPKAKLYEVGGGVGDVIYSPVTAYVEHEEHSKIELPGRMWFKVTRQREYVPKALPRQVAD